jgi:hypothetical protein
MDFDTLSFPPAGWTQTQAGPSSWETSTTAVSPPNAFKSNTQLNDTTAVAGRATFDWAATTGAAAKSVNVKAQINPFPPQRSSSWPDSVDVLCVALIATGGDSYGCLSYTYDSPRDWSTNYTGYFIRVHIVRDTVVDVQCPISASVTSQAWSSAELTMAGATGNVDVVLNGTRASCTSTLPPFGTSAANVWVGTRQGEWLRAAGDGVSGMSVTYDNVVATVRR